MFKKEDLPMPPPGPKETAVEGEGLPRPPS